MKREENDWKTESQQFDKAADIYDKFRPSYPIELIEQIISNTGIRKGDMILEVGAGSGKATELFVNKGFNLTCIEPGENLANIGNKKFGESGQVEYVITRLEEWNEIMQVYDLAISAQAFHWVPKPIGFQKLSEALKEDGYMALFWNMYVNYANQFVNDISKVCAEFSVMWMEDRAGIDNRISNIQQEIVNSNYFSEAQVYEYPWELEDTYEDFINFLSTGNGYIGMNHELRLEINSRIMDIFNRAGGKITRRFNCVLFLSKTLGRCKL